MKLGAGVGLAILVLVVGFFFLASWLAMVLVNVILHHYGVTPLDYGCGMALVGLSALLFGGSRFNTSKE